MTKKWYVLCTKPQQELKVVAALLKKGIDSYCPLTRRMLVNSGFRKKIVWNPVFPSFVFVHITEDAFTTVCKTNEVVSMMYWMGKPAVVADADIYTIENFVSRYPNVTIEKTAIVKGADAANNLPAAEQVQDENIRKVIPTIGFVLIASRERNYRIVNRNIENGKTAL